MPSQNDLVEVFKAKAARRSCPWCDTNDWFVASGGDKFAAILLSNIEGVAKADGLEALPITCRNCGYVQLHLTSVLEKAVEHS
jgi:predicted nucleic-acid-binding Zn-ribbon protein